MTVRLCDADRPFMDADVRLWTYVSFGRTVVSSDRVQNVLAHTQPRGKAVSGY